MQIGYWPAALENLKLIGTAIALVLTVINAKDKSPEGRPAAISH
jgi:hypothetical protein